MRIKSLKYKIISNVRKNPHVENLVKYFNNIETSYYAGKIGYEFYDNGRYCVGVYPIYAEKVKEIFEIGLMSHLMRLNLIPITSISNGGNEFFPVVLKFDQDMMPVFIYYYEMSFSMIKDCGNMILKLANVLFDFGYRLRSCRMDKVMFSGSRLTYCSFSGIEKGEFSFPYYEFMQLYVLPLRVMSLNPQNANIFMRQSHSISVEEYLKYYYGIKHKIKVKLDLFAISVSSEMHKKRRKQLSYYKKKLELTAKNIHTSWGGYQNIEKIKAIFGGNDISPDVGFRYKRVMEIIRGLKAETVLEYGCNAGMFSIMFMKTEVNIKRYIATDYDEIGIDKLYGLIRSNSAEYPFLKNIYPAVVDFCETHRRINEEIASDRFRSDICLAMALTHHLLLTQHISMRDMFRQFYESTNRYLIVEFMPKGLWNGHNVPHIPSWYTIENFKYEMGRFFEIEIEETVMENRVIFLGVKKSVTLEY